MPWKTQYEVSSQRIPIRITLSTLYLALSRGSSPPVVQEPQSLVEVNYQDRHIPLGVQYQLGTGTDNPRIKAPISVNALCRAHLTWLHSETGWIRQTLYLRTF